MLNNLKGQWLVSRDMCVCLVCVLSKASNNYSCKLIITGKTSCVVFQFPLMGSVVNIMGGWVWS